MAWQRDRGEKVTAYSRLVTHWIPLCMTNAMAFNSLLIVSETDLRSSSGRDPW